MTALLTNVGIGKVIAALNGDAHTPPTYLGWGTGSTAAAATDTTLETASSEARTNGSKSKQTTNSADDTYRVVGTITSTGSQTISEVGLFDASTSGSLYVRGVFTGIPLVNGDAIEFTVNTVLDQA